MADILDYAALRFMGKSDADIDLIARKGDTISLLDKEPAWEKYQSFFPGGRDEFDKRYDEVAKDHGKFTQGQFVHHNLYDGTLPLSWYTEQKGLADRTVFSAIEKGRQENYRPGQYVTNEFGVPYKLAQPTWVAEQNGIVIDEYGNKKPLDQRNPDLMLVAEPDKDLGWVYKEKKWTDEVQSDNIRSWLLGPGRMNPSVVRGMSGMFSGAVGNLAYLAQLPDIFSDLWDGFGNDYKDVHDVWDDIGNWGKNKANFLSTHDDYRSMINMQSMSNAIGQAIQSVAEAAAFSLLFAETGPVAPVLGISAAVGRRLATSAAIGTGAIISAAMSKNTAKDMGFSDFNASLIAIPMGALTYGVENHLFASNILQKMPGAIWAGEESELAASKYLREFTRKKMLEEGFDPATATGPAMNRFVQEASKGWLGRMTSWAGRANENLVEFANKSKLHRIGSAALEEGGEEIVEGSLQKFIEASWDTIYPYVNSDAKKGNGLFGTNYSDMVNVPQLAAQGFLGAIGGAGAGVVMPFQKQNNASDEIMNFLVRGDLQTLQESELQRYQKGMLANTSYGPDGLVQPGSGKKSWNDYYHEWFVNEVQMNKNIWENSGLKEWVDQAKKNGVDGYQHLYVSTATDVAKQALYLERQHLELQKKLQNDQLSEDEKATLTQQVARNRELAQDVWDSKTKTSNVYDRWWNDITAMSTKNGGYEEKYASYMKGDWRNEDPEKYFSYAYMKSINDFARAETERIGQQVAEHNKTLTEGEPGLVTRLTDFGKSLKGSQTQWHSSALRSEFNKVLDHIGLITSETGDEMINQLLQANAPEVTPEEAAAYKQVSGLDIMTPGMTWAEVIEDPLTFDKAFVDQVMNQSENARKYNESIGQVSSAIQRRSPDAKPIPFDPIKTFAQQYLGFYQPVKQANGKHTLQRGGTIRDILEFAKQYKEVSDEQMTLIKNAGAWIDMMEAFGETEANVFRNYEPKDVKKLQGLKVLNGQEYAAVRQEINELRKMHNEVMQNLQVAAKAFVERKNTYRKNRLQINVELLEGLNYVLTGDPNKINEQFTGLKDLKTVEDIDKNLTEFEKKYYDLHAKIGNQVVGNKQLHKQFLQRMFGGDGTKMDILLLDYKDAYRLEPDKYMSYQRFMLGTGRPLSGDEKIVVTDSEKSFALLSAIDFISSFEIDQTAFNVAAQNYNESLRGVQPIEWTDVEGNKVQVILPKKEALTQEQESAVRSAMPYMIGDKDWSFVESLVEYVAEPGKGSKMKAQLNQNIFSADTTIQKAARKSFWIRGYPGVGKSVVLPRAITSMMKSMSADNKGPNVIVVAPTQYLIDQVARTLEGTASITKSTLLSDISTTTVPNTTDLIIFDEVSFFNEEMTERVMQWIGSNSGNVLFLGDEAQTSGRNTPNAEANGTTYLAFNVMRSFPVITRFRTGVQSNVYLQDELVRHVFNKFDPKAINFPEGFYNDDEGMQYVKSKEEVINQFIIDTKAGKDTVLVVTRIQDVNDLLKNRPELIPFAERVRPAEYHEGKQHPFVGGEPFDNVYVAIDELEGDANYTRNLLSGISRARKKALVISRAGVSTKVDTVAKMQLNLKILSDHFASMSDRYKTLTGKTVAAKETAVTNTTEPANYSKSQQDTLDILDSMMFQSEITTPEGDMLVFTTPTGNINVLRTHEIISDSDIPPDQMVIGELVDKIVQSIITGQPAEPRHTKDIVIKGATQVYDAEIRTDGEHGLDAFTKELQSWMEPLLKQGAVFRVQQRFYAKRDVSATVNGKTFNALGGTADIIAVMPAGNAHVYEVKAKQKVQPMEEVRNYRNYVMQTTAYAGILRSLGIKADVSMLLIHRLGESHDGNRFTLTGLTSSYKNAQGVPTTVSINPARPVDDDHKKLLDFFAIPYERDKPEEKETTIVVPGEAEITNGDTVGTNIAGTTWFRHNFVNDSLVGAHTRWMPENITEDQKTEYRNLRTRYLSLRITRDDSRPLLIDVKYNSKHNKTVLLAKADDIAAVLDPKIPAQAALLKQWQDTGTMDDDRLIIGVLPESDNTDHPLEKRLSWYHSQAKANKPVTMRIDKLIGASYNIRRMGKALTYKELVEEIETLGSNTSGNDVIQGFRTTKNEDGKEVTRVVKFMRVNYLPGGSKASDAFIEFDSLPLYQKVAADPDYLQAIRSSMDGKETKWEITNSLMGQFFKENGFYLYPKGNVSDYLKAILDKHPEVSVPASVKQYLGLKWSNESQVTVFNKLVHTPEQVAEFANGLKALFEIITFHIQSKDDFGFDKLRVPTIRDRATGKITNTEDLVTHYQNVGMPIIYMADYGETATATADEGGATGATQQQRPFRKAFRGKGNPMLEEVGEMPLYIQRASGKRVSLKGRGEAVKVLEKIFGEAFINNELDFHPNPKWNNRKVWGVMEEGRMVLKEQDGKVNVIAARHEAIHKILSTLLDEKSERAILDSAKNYLREKFGQPNMEISDFHAHEFLAESFQSRYNGVSGVVNRFLDWLRKTLNNWGLHKEDFRTFFYDVETGKFRDKKVLRSSGESYPMAEDLTGEEDVEEYVERLTGKKSSFELSQDFGSQWTANRIALELVDEVVSLTDYNPSFFFENGIHYSYETFEEAFYDVYTRLRAQADTLTDRISQHGISALMDMVRDAGGTEVLNTIESGLQRDYEMWLAAQPEYFSGLISLVTPGFSLQDRMIYDVLVREQEQDGVFAEDEAFIRSREQQFGEGTAINTTDFMNQKLRMIMSVIPKVDRNGEPTGEYLEFRQLTDTITENAVLTPYMNDDDVLRALVTQLSAAAALEKVSDSEKTTIRSFLKWLGSNVREVPMNSARRVDVTKLNLMHYDHSIDRIRMDYAGTALEPAIRRKDYAVNMLMNAVASHFGSLQMNRRAILDVSEPGNVRRRLPEAASAAERKNQHKQDIFFTNIFIGTDGHFLPTPTLWNASKEVELTPNSIKFYGKVVLQVNENGTFSFPDGFKLPIVRQILRYVGLRNVYLPAMQAYLNSDPNINTGLQEEVSERKLAQILGELTLATYNMFYESLNDKVTRINKMKKKDRDTDEFKETLALHKKVSSGYTKKYQEKVKSILLAGGASDESIEQSINSEEVQVAENADEFTNRRIISPQGLWTHLEQIAQVEVMSGVGSRTRFVFRKGGRRVYHVNQSGYSAHVIPVGDSPLAGNKPYTYLAKLFDRMDKSMLMVDDGKGGQMMSIPLFSDKQGWNIHGEVVMDSERSDFGENTIKDAMPVLDLVYSMFHPFVSDIVRTDVNKKSSLTTAKIVLPGVARIDSGKYSMYEIELGAREDSPLPFKLEKVKEATDEDPNAFRYKMTINHQGLDRQVENLFKLAMNERKASAMKVMQAILSNGDLFGIDPSGYNVQAQSEIVAQMDPDSVWNYFMELNQKVEDTNREELVRRFQRSGLTANLDYKTGFIRGKRYILPGHALMMDFYEVEENKQNDDTIEYSIRYGNQTFNYDNYQLITQAESRREAVHNIMTPLMRELTQLMSAVGYQIPEIASEMFVVNDKPRLSQATTEKFDFNGEERTRITGWKFHPMVELFTYLSFLNITYTNKLLYGNTMQHASPVKFFQRAKSAITAGTAPRTNGRYGPGQFSRAIEFSRNEVINPSVQAAHGETVTATPGDGSIKINPFSRELFRMGFGGEFGMMDKIGSDKPHYFWNDLQTMISDHLKMGQFAISEQTMQEDPLDQRLFELSTPAEIMQVYQEARTRGLDFNAAVREGAMYALEHPEVREKLVDFLLNPGAKKSGRINTVNIDEMQSHEGLLSFATQLDNRGYRMILDYKENQGVTDGNMIGQMIFLSMTGEQNQEHADLIMRIQSRLAENTISGVGKELALKGYDGLLRSLGKQAARRMQNDTQFSRLIENPNISPSGIQSLHTRTTQILASKLTNDGIKMSMPGGMYVRYSGHGMKVYPMVVSNQGQFLRFGEDAGPNEQVVERGRRDILKMGGDAMLAQAEQFAHPYRDIRQVNGQFKQGNVAMPIPEKYRQLFGMSANDTMHDVLGVNVNGTPFDMTYMTEAHVGQMIQLIVDAAKATAPFTYEEEGTDKVIKFVVPAIIPKTGNRIIDSIVQKMQADMKKEDSPVLKNWSAVNQQKLAKEVFRLKDSFVKWSSNIIVSRMPGGPGAFGLNRIVTFINDQSNTIFVSPELNARVGSDDDGDTEYVNYHFINGNGHIPAKEPDEKGVKKRDLQNMIVGAMSSWFRNPANFHFMTMPIHKKVIQDAAAEYINDPEHFSRPHSDPNSPAYTMQMLFEGNVGKTLVGAVANLKKAVSFLDAWMQRSGESVIEMEQEDTETVLDALYAFINQALDDTKDLTMGPLGITLANINAIGSLLISEPMITRNNETDELLSANDRIQNLIDFISLPHVRSVIWRWNNVNNSLHRYNRNLYELIDNTIRIKEEKIKYYHEFDEEEKIDALMNRRDELREQAELSEDQEEELDDLNNFIEIYLKEGKNIGEDGAKNYGEQRVNNLLDQIRDLQLLRKHFIRGQAIFEFGQFASLNQGLKGNPYSRYTFMKLLEKKTGRVLTAPRPMLDQSDMNDQMGLMNFFTGYWQEGRNVHESYNLLEKINYKYSGKNRIAPGTTRETAEQIQAKNDEQVALARQIEESVHDMIPVARIISESPNMDSWVRLYSFMQDTVLSESFTENRNFIGSSRNSMVSAMQNYQKLDNVTTQQFYDLTGFLSDHGIRVFMWQHFKLHPEDHAPFNWLSNVITSQFQGLAGTETSLLPVSTGGEMQFKMFMTKLVEMIQAGDIFPELLQNDFVRQLGVQAYNGLPTIVFRDGMYLGPKMKESMYAASNELHHIYSNNIPIGRYFSRLMDYYQFVTFGFGFRAGSLAEFISPELQEQYSRFYTQNVGNLKEGGYVQAGDEWIATGWRNEIGIVNQDAGIADLTMFDVMAKDLPATLFSWQGDGSELAPPHLQRRYITVRGLTGKNRFSDRTAVIEPLQLANDEVRMVYSVVNTLFRNPYPGEEQHMVTRNAIMNNIPWDVMERVLRRLPVTIDMGSRRITNQAGKEGAVIHLLGDAYRLLIEENNYDAGFIKGSIVAGGTLRSGMQLPSSVRAQQELGLYVTLDPRKPAVPQIKSILDKRGFKYLEIPDGVVIQYREVPYLVDSIGDEGLNVIHIRPLDLDYPVMVNGDEVYLDMLPLPQNIEGRENKVIQHQSQYEQRIGSTVGSVLKFAAEQGSAVPKAFSKAVMDVMKGSGVKVQWVDEVINDKDSSVAGEYDIPSRTIKLSRQALQFHHYHGTMQQFADEASHEVVHSMLAYRVGLFESGQLEKLTDDEKGILNDLKALYDYAKTNTLSPFQYGYSSFQEFISEAISSQQFQKELDSIRGMPEVTLTVWERIKDLLTQLFNKILGKAPSELRMATTGLIFQLAKTHSEQFESTSRYNWVMGKLFAPSKKINNLLEFSTMMKSEDVKYHMDKDTIINDYYEKFLRSSDGTVYFNGVKETIKGNSEAEIKSDIEKKIYDKMVSRDKNRKTSLINWLNDGSRSTIREHLGEYMGKDDTDSMYVALKYKYMDWEGNYQHFMYNSDESKNLDLYVPQFEGFNPIITNHQVNDKGELEISITDDTSIILNRNKNRLFAHLGTTSEYFDDNEAGYRKFMLALTAMAIKQKNPSVRFRRIGVLSLNKSVIGRYIMMPDVLPYIKRLRSNPKFMELVGPDIQKVLNDDKLYNPELYDQSYLWHLRQYYEEHGKQKDEWFDHEYYNYMTTRLTDAAQERDNLVDAIKFRMAKLESKVPADEMYRLYNKKEYRLLTEALTALEKKYSKQVNPARDSSWLNSNYLKSLATADSELVQFAYKRVEIALFKTKDEVWNTIRKHNEHLKNTVMPAYYQGKNRVKLLTDRVAIENMSAKFEGLFRTEMIDKKAAKVLRIWWDKNDPETRRAIADGRIHEDRETAEKLVDYGKWVVEQIRGNIKTLLAHKIRTNEAFLWGLSKEQSEAEIEKRAEAETNKIYERGMIPAITMTSADSFAHGEWKLGWDKFWNSFASPVNIYDEVGKNAHDDYKVGEQFISQFSASNLHYGSNDRLNIMGLQLDGGKLQFTDENANKSLSYDLQFIVNYMTSAVSRKVNLEQYAMHEINAVLAMLYNYNQSDGNEQKWNMEAIKLFKDRVIHGKVQQIDEMVDLPSTANWKENAANLDKGLNLLIHSTIFGALTFNVPSALGQLLTQGIGTLNTAVTNLVGDTHWYTPADVAKAAKLFTTEPNLISKIIEHYHLADHDERNMVQSFRFKEGTKNWWDSWIFNWGNWAPDYYFRVVNSIAQMIHDGTLEAHSLDKNGELVVDESKVKMFQGEKGKALREHIYRQNVMEGQQDPKNKKLTKVYDSSTILAMRDYVAQHVTGALESTERSNVGHGVWSRLFSTWKSFIFRKWENFYTKEMYKDTTGYWVVEEKKTPNGVIKEVVWKKELFEGKYQSVIRAVREIRQAREQGLNYWDSLKQMPDRSKSNLARLGMDMFIFMTLMMAYGFTIGGDDEDKIKKRKGARNLSDNRFFRILRYSAQDMINEWYPPYVVDMFHEPFPAISFLNNSVQMTEAFMTGQVERGLQILGSKAPGASTVRLFESVLGDDKGAPLKP